MLQQARQRALEAHVAFLRTDNQRLKAQRRSTAQDTANEGTATALVLASASGGAPGDVDDEAAERLVMSIGQELQACIVERDDARRKLRACMQHRDELVAELESRVNHNAQDTSSRTLEVVALRDDVERLSTEYV